MPSAQSTEQHSVQRQVKVFVDPRSTCSRTVLAVLNERGVEFEMNVVNLAAKDQKTPEHLAMQPFGRVPVLVDGDRTLFESKAIIKYIDLTFPGKKLTPSDPFKYYLMENWLSVYDSYYTPHAHVIFFEKLLKKRYNMGEPDLAKVEQAAEQLGTVLDVMEKHLSEHAFLGGDEFSLADAAYLARFECTEAAGYSHLHTARPHLNSWWQQCKTRAAWQSTLATTMEPKVQIKMTKRARAPKRATLQADRE